MTTLLLIRHGHYLGQKEPHPDLDPDNSLDDLGRSQIEALTARLKGETIKIVLTSQLKRARESGEIISKELHLPIESTAVLNELGFFIKPQEIMTFERDEEKYKQALKDLQAASQRAVQFLKEISTKHWGETVAVVCHGNIIRAIIGQALKSEIETGIRMQVDLASLSILEYDGGDLFRLIKLNDTSHLED